MLGVIKRRGTNDNLPTSCLQDANPEAQARIGEVMGFAEGRVRVRWVTGVESDAAPAELFIVSTDEEADEASASGKWHLLKSVCIFRPPRRAGRRAPRDATCLPTCELLVQTRSARGLMSATPLCWCSLKAAEGLHHMRFVACPAQRAVCYWRVLCSLHGCSKLPRPARVLHRLAATLILVGLADIHQLPNFQGVDMQELVRWQEPCSEGIPQDRGSSRPVCAHPRRGRTSLANTIATAAMRMSFHPMRALPQSCTKVRHSEATSNHLPSPSGRQTMPPLQSQSR